MKITVEVDNIEEFNFFYNTLYEIVGVENFSNSFLPLITSYIF